MEIPVCRAVKKYVVYGLVCGAVLFIGAGVRSGPDGTFVHSVRAGESISLLCIDFYGYYSTRLGNAVRNLNPAVKDINLIYPGQKICFRIPETVGAANASSNVVASSGDTVAEKGSVVRTQLLKNEKSDDSLFVRKVKVTQGVVTCVEGTVVYRDEKNSLEKPLEVNTVLAPGAVITTKKDGRLELIINREAVVRMGAVHRCRAWLELVLRRAARTDS